MNRSVTGAPFNIKVTVCHTAGHYGEEYGDWNSDVFTSWRNRSSDGAEWTDGGRAFHAQAAVTGKKLYMGIKLQRLNSWNRLLAGTE